MSLEDKELGEQKEALDLKYEKFINSYIPK